jgi:hypothetical protein
LTRRAVALATGGDSDLTTRRDFYQPIPRRVDPATI